MNEKSVINMLKYAGYEKTENKSYYIFKEKIKNDIYGTARKRIVFLHKEEDYSEINEDKKYKDFFKIIKKDLIKKRENISSLIFAIASQNKFKKSFVLDCSKFYFQNELIIYTDSNSINFKLKNKEVSFKVNKDRTIQFEDKVIYMEYIEHFDNIVKGYKYRRILQEENCFTIFIPKVIPFNNLNKIETIKIKDDKIIINENKEINFDKFSEILENNLTFFDEEENYYTRNFFNVDKNNLEKITINKKIKFKDITSQVSMSGPEKDHEFFYDQINKRGYLISQNILIKEFDYSSLVNDTDIKYFDGRYHNILYYDFYNSIFLLKRTKGIVDLSNFKHTTLEPEDDEFFDTYLLKSKFEQIKKKNLKKLTGERNEM